MIEILLKNKESIKAKSVEELKPSELDFFVMQFLDHSVADINWLRNNYGLDFSIMKHFEDIEISSHFVENEHQAAFHFSIPFYNKEKKVGEEPMFVIISQEGLFLFMSSNLDAYFNEIYPSKINSLQRASDLNEIFKFQFEFVSDYFADITENLSKKIKNLANEILIKKEFSTNVMDYITQYNFNNLLIKESLIETTRVLRLYLKSNWEKETELRDYVRDELNDLTVISDYIQFNFDRLDDLKENVSNKIDLEQNHIFKMLTIVTVCISLPTFIAGVYGMNFDRMPELHYSYGYPIVIFAMICSAILPFLYFKRKKWL